MLTTAVFFPIICGLLLFAVPRNQRKIREACTLGAALLTSCLVLVCLLTRRGQTEDVILIVRGMNLSFSLDGMGTVFAALVAVLWPIAVLYGFEYMRHEGGERHFFALYTMTYGITLGIAFAGNLLTMYVFYEFLSLITLPLVMHGSSEAVQRAGRTYYMYTFFGAALALVGMIPVLVYGGSAFALGGSMSAETYALHPIWMQVCFLCCFLGFAVKAAIFPFHSWLPKAAVAPTPVTALLHAVAVVKAGAFAAIRVSYYVFDPEEMRGTAVQAAIICLASFTILYGAYRAVRDHHLKRRLAWSTVSNLSYILMAAALLTGEGRTAALSHLVFHGLIKITLFYCAGAILVQTRKTEIESMRGLRQEMPLTAAVYTLAALALAGTPLLPAFASKWMIGTAALASGGWMGVLGLGAILVSAVLCAVYDLTPAFFMLFREPEAALDGNRDPGPAMKTALVLLALLILLSGIFSNTLITFIAEAVSV